jgi:hypothetical protein
MPVINKPNQHFDATLWTGDNTNPRSITNGAAGQSFQPDLVWVKARNSGQFHVLNDSVRGAGTALGLSSQATNAEGNADIGLYGATTAFNSTGFSVGAGTSNQAFVNLSGVTYVAWQWKAGGAAVTNTSGSVNSQVSANPTAGFSIVTYDSGTGTTDRTAGHGLGVAPSFIITKSRSSSSFNWSIYHASVATTVKKYLTFTTDALSDNGINIWGSAFPTSSVFGFTSGNGVVASTNCIAYCFAPVAGYSAFGSYTGNGSADGPFIYTGFKPKFVMFKNASGGAWEIFDSSRGLYNEMTGTNVLYPNTSVVEGNDSANRQIDFLSNGIKIRCTGGDTNGSGNSIIYAAFAESPFKFANAR